MTTASLVAVGLGLLLVVAAGVVILWVIDARRAEHVAADPERVQGRPPRRRWWQRTSGRQ
jgi:hypothetical protein